MILFEDDSTFTMRPLTFTRPLFHLRVGIDTISQKWERHLKQSVGAIAAGFLAPFFNQFVPTGNAVFINGNFLPDAAFLEAISSLEPGDALTSPDSKTLYAICGSAEEFSAIDFTQPVEDILGHCEALKTMKHHPVSVQYPWDLFRLANSILKRDFLELTAGKVSCPITDPHTIVYGKENIFLEEGVKIRAAILNAENGPIYIGKNAEIQEGAIITGAHLIGEGATVNVGAKLRGDSVIGPYCKVGGEISNSVLLGFSNKGHDGFLGNSVLGEWCNLGADTNTSNLKNNYQNPKVYNYKAQGAIDCGTLFCGLIMGDHSKSGINTMFNTGTVVGVSCNIFGGDFPPTHVPSFSWGGGNQYAEYIFAKATDVMERVMKRRNKTLSEKDRQLLESVFQFTAKDRARFLVNHRQNG